MKNILCALAIFAVTIEGAATSTEHGPVDLTGDSTPMPSKPGIVETGRPANTDNFKVQFVTAVHEVNLSRLDQAMDHFLPKSKAMVTFTHDKDKVTQILVMVYQKTDQRHSVKGKGVSAGPFDEKIDHPEEKGAMFESLLKEACKDPRSGWEVYKPEDKRSKEMQRTRYIRTIKK